MSKKTSYRTSPIKRQRRTKEDIEFIKGGIIEVLSETNPMTVRQVFYQLTSRGYGPKLENFYKGTVCRLLKDMREDGTIPFEYIVDNSRWMRKSNSFSSIEDALNHNIKTYRRNLWDRQNVYVEIWIEKDALAGIIFDITDEWDVPLMVSKGFSSSSYIYETAKYLNSIDKPVYIYHFGDYDPSGLDISRDTEARLRRYAPEVDIHFERLAVTEEQISLWNLPRRPTKKTDPRAKNFDGDSVELDSIPVNDLRQIVQYSILQHVNAEEYREIKRVELLERESLSWVFRNIHIDGADVFITKEFNDAMIDTQARTMTTKKGMEK